MELKQYQSKVIADLNTYLDFFSTCGRADIAYKNLWDRKSIHPPRPWNAVLGETPMVCMKVPTAGGKTFLGINAIASIFGTIPMDQHKVVVWLVPSATILDQTIKNFRNTSHEYRLKMNQLFQNRVDVYDKEQLLNGTSFAQSATESTLNILVLSYDSFRSNRKEDRRVYRENSALAEIASSLPAGTPIDNADETSLANVLNLLRPVVIIDEAHNANSDLSVDMLKNLNPIFVLELTATPRERSNLISIVDSLALKKENMVKLPTFVYNNTDQTEVILNAITLRNNLEIVAKKELEDGAPYVRPIVLFQAQPASKDAETQTFNKLKQKLLDCQIPENEIAVKTANINTLKNVDLLSETCSIRYIITVNALKEGWDCPFAYILATIANKSSQIDVEQIVGRILRQPHQRRFKNSLLNLSYVITSSATFLQTVERIVGALQLSGYSRSDFRAVEFPGEDVLPVIYPKPQDLAFIPSNGVTKAEDIDQIDCSKINAQLSKSSNSIPTIPAWQDLAMRIEQQVNETAKKTDTAFPESIWGENTMKQMVPEYVDTVKLIKLPQFYMKVEIPTLFAGKSDFDENYQKVDFQMLMDGFKLSQQDTQITFDAIPPDMYQIDIDDSTREHEVKLKKLDQRSMELFTSFLSHLSTPDQIRELAARITSQLSSVKWLPSKDSAQYVIRVLEGLDSNMHTQMARDPWRFASKIKNKINSLAADYAHKTFVKGISSGKIICRAEWAFPTTIEVTDSRKGIIKCLYVEENSMNELEFGVINDIANLSNILCWHRIIERRDYHINGWWGNHYPDFIIITQNANVILVEAKGGDRDNSDTEKKIELGRRWQEVSGESIGGRKWRYFCVFDKDPMDGAIDKTDLLETLKNL